MVLPRESSLQNKFDKLVDGNAERCELKNLSTKRTRTGTCLACVTKGKRAQAPCVNLSLARSLAPSIHPSIHPPIHPIHPSTPGGEDEFSHQGSVWGSANNLGLSQQCSILMARRESTTSRWTQCVNVSACTSSLEVLMCTAVL